jgi:hypothetical protein
MLEPNTPMPPLQAFYSNNTPAPTPLTPSRPFGNDVQGQGQGHDHGRYCGKGGEGNGGDCSTPGHGNQGQGNKGPDNKLSPASTCWPSFYNPWIGTINMYLSLVSRRGGGSNCDVPPLSKDGQL